MRQRFLDSALKILKFNSPEYDKFIKNVAGIMSQESASKFIPGILKSPVKNLLNLGVTIHPAIKSAPGFYTLSPDIKKELIGKSFDEAKYILEQKTVGTQFLQDFKQYIAQRGPGYFSEKYLQFAPRSKGKIVEQGILKLVEKFPQLEEALGKFGGAKIVFGKILGPIILAMDAINLWRDVDVYGWDGKNICQLVSIIIGSGAIASTVATGGAATPLAIALSALWLVASIGCGLVAQHDMPISGKSTPQLQENTDQITDNNIKNLIGKVKMSDLPMDDQHRAREIFNNWKNNKQAMKRNFYEQAKGGLFKKPVSVLAGLESYLRDGSFF